MAQKATRERTGEAYSTRVTQPRLANRTDARSLFMSSGSAVAGHEDSGKSNEARRRLAGVAFGTRPSGSVRPKVTRDSAMSLPFKTDRRSGKANITVAGMEVLVSGISVREHERHGIGSLWIGEGTKRRGVWNVLPQYARSKLRLSCKPLGGSCGLLMWRQGCDRHCLTDTTNIV
jgi:hypothetical protein